MWMAKFGKDAHSHMAEQACSHVVADRMATSERMFVFSFYLEKALPYPKLGYIVAYHKRNLYVYNFGCLSQYRINRAGLEISFGVHNRCKRTIPQRYIVFEKSAKERYHITTGVRKISFNRNSNSDGCIWHIVYKDSHNNCSVYRGIHECRAIANCKRSNSVVSAKVKVECRQRTKSRLTGYINSLGDLHRKNIRGSDPGFVTATQSILPPVYLVSWIFDIQLITYG
ncbi:hypothetical protein CEXT_259731 [Caerostris extrusa]|uniref:Uncharacterized protein n=1 Tax=Caerostris extrusa TaxID=172846 RepID=A0AAV4M593_CAEEX|nr:hypothetical protein CEXT_259731 [Caerostris extrusa]